MRKIKISEVSEFDEVFRNNVGSDFDELVTDFIMIAGMSIEEANQAASNVLNYDIMQD